MEPAELREFAALCSALATYAYALARAKQHRVAGNIQRAMAEESICDELYKALPQGAKW